MAKMYGKFAEPHQNSKGWTKAAMRHDEENLVFTEADQEMYEERDEKHARGICFDPKSKMYGCDYCYDNTDYHDASELDGVPGVWTNAERLIY